MSDTSTATKPAKTRKPNVGSDPTKGSKVKQWQYGLYAFAFGATAILVGLNLFYILNGRFSRMFAALTILVGGLSWMLVTAKNSLFKESKGVKVTSAEPALRDFVQQVADQVGGTMPDDIFLEGPATYGLLEDTRLFGMRVETSVLKIGMPYLQALTKQEFASLLAHSFGHHADCGIEDGPRAYRGLRAARDLITVERQGFINGVYGSYARKMFRSVGGVGVAQEEAADRLAVDTYGTDAAISSLEKYDEVPVAFDQLLRDYVVPALQNQMHPTDMYAGFAEMMKSDARAAERRSLVDKRREAERNEFNLHRNPVERIDEIRDWDHVAGAVQIPDGDASAATLLDAEAKTAEIVVATWAKELMTERTTPHTWQELTDEIYSVKTQSLASMVFDEETEPATQLEQAFEWSASDDWSRVDGPIEAGLKKIKDPVERRTKWARCVVVEAAVTTGAFSWQHSWDGPPILVDDSGESLDAAGIAKMIVAGDAAEARASFDAAVSVAS